MASAIKDVPPPVPSELLRRNPVLFCGRIALAASIISAASLCMLSGSAILFVIGVLIQGAMYVHLVELQHAVLHMQVFRGQRVARTIGFFLGLPMMISYSEFRHRHLQHHIHLGTALNTETFNYRHAQLNCLSGFVVAMLDYSRLPAAIAKILRALSALPNTVESSSIIEAHIRREHQLIGMFLALTICWSLLSRSPNPILLWLVPLLVAEPVHFLLELPEHFGLPAHTNPSVFENTRSWGGSLWARWFTHNTNYHVAHHFHQAIPMESLPKLQPLLEAHIPSGSRSPSYFQFYLDVIKGEIVDHKTSASTPDTQFRGKLRYDKE